MSSNASIIDRFADGLAFILNLTAASTLMGLMLVTCVDVFGRYLFNHPLVGTTELTEMGLCILIFAAFPVISWRDEHIVVDMLDKFTHPLVHLIRSMLINVVSAFALYFLGSRIIKLGNRSLDYGEVSEYLTIPLGWVINFIGIMCWLAALCLITLGVFLAIQHYRMHIPPEGSLYR